MNETKTSTLRFGFVSVLFIVGLRCRRHRHCCFIDSVLSACDFILGPSFVAQKCGKVRLVQLRSNDRIVL